MAALKNGPSNRVAVVLPGGGVRGAYETGVLAELLPALAERGERVSIYCGTSVGAINAASLAALAHLSPSAQAEALLERWESLRRGDVLERILGPRTPLRAARLLAEIAGVPGVRAGGLLQPALDRSLKRWIDWDRLHRNVRDGHVHSLCVIATALADGTSVGFIEREDGDPLEGPSGEIRCVETGIGADHVRASAAIPFLFPPVEVHSPGEAAGFYIDGGTRLNSPIKPAIDLGADRIAVVGFEPLARPASAGRTNGSAPKLTDVAVNVLDGLITDQVGADMHRLAAVNSFFAEGFASTGSSAGRAYRESRGRRPYRRIGYALVAPRRPGELGELAERVYRERYGGVRGMRDPDFVLLGRLLRAGGSSRGELLSFLLFDAAFVEELVAAGRRDARHWLARHPKVWCTDSAHDFDLDPARATRERELADLDEWRALSRR